MSRYTHLLARLVFLIPRVARVLKGAGVAGRNRPAEVGGGGREAAAAREEPSSRKYLCGQFGKTFDGNVESVGDGFAAINFRVGAHQSSVGFLYRSLCL